MLISPELKGDGHLHAGGYVLMYPKHSHIFLNGGRREGNPWEGWGRMAREARFPCWLVSLADEREALPGACSVYVTWRSRAGGMEGEEACLRLCTQLNRCLGSVCRGHCAGLSEALRYGVIQVKGPALKIYMNLPPCPLKLNSLFS